MSDSTAERERKLDEVIAAYMQSLALGQAPSHEEWLAAHPDFAPDLAEFLADRERFERWAVPVRSAIAQSSASPTKPAPGLKLRYIGDYELLDEIAHGGMGVIYRARQLSLNRLVALKMVLTGFFATPTAMHRFHAEAEAAAALDHPNIVPIYEINEYEGQPYFTMKLIEGGNLKSLLPELKQDPKRTAKLLSLVARAVHHAHQHGIIHRDLKPSNILIDAEGSPHLTDFGLARRVGTDGITLTGDVLGTPGYMPPEQAAGRKDAISTLSDVYSLGAILYEALTGQPPFQGENAFETLKKVREDELVPPSHVYPRVDRDLEAICLKCLAKEPRERYGSAAELADDLDRWLAGESLSVRPETLGAQIVSWLRRNIRAAVWVTLVGGLGGLLGGFLIAFPKLNSILVDAKQTYSKFPSLQQPSITQYWIDIQSDHLAKPCLLLSGIVFVLIGPTVIVLIRPIRPWEDLKLGIITGGVVSCAAYIGGIGSLNGQYVNSATYYDLDLLSQATKTPKTPRDHPTDVLVHGYRREFPRWTEVHGERRALPSRSVAYLGYPELKEVPPDERADVVISKIYADSVVSHFQGIWLVISSVIVLVGGGVTLTTAATGYILRRNRWHLLPSIVPWFEINVPGCWLVITLSMAVLQLIVHAPGIRMDELLGVIWSGLLFGFAISGVTKRWPILLRLTIYATLLSLALTVLNFHWVTVLSSVISGIALTGYLAYLYHIRKLREVARKHSESDETKTVA